MIVLDIVGISSEYFFEIPTVHVSFYLVSLTIDIRKLYVLIGHGFRDVSDVRQKISTRRTPRGTEIIKPFGTIIF